MKEGDPVDVKVISVDRDGKIRLTRRELLPFPEGPEGDRARERIQQAREAGPPTRSGAGGRGDRRDGPPGGRSGGPRR
jgi:polyribonucleotide nucleotidyltransferase